MPTQTSTTPDIHRKPASAGLLPNPWPLMRTGHRWLARMQRREARVDRHRMVWLERGQAGPDRPTVVLLHGFASMKENWSAWLPLLPRQWHLLVPDLPGFGESDYHSGADYRFEVQARRLAGWLEQQGLRENLHLVGSSMGGAIATVLAHNLEPQARSLTVLNSAGIPIRPDLDLAIPPKTEPSLLVPESWRGVYRMFNNVGDGKPTLMGLAMTGLLGVDLMRRARGHREIFADMMADPYAPVRYLKGSRLPLHVQWGDRDAITPTRCVDYYRTTLPHAQIQIFKGVGHVPMLETPRRSAQALAHFVNSQTSRTV
ncbi:MAG: alpha/beta hydrolase [Marinobacter sp.]|uniref:alpha/beta fold hydrolase n=1 Tax=Marinobacter sp. TaxID=50741 RepID=UPI00299DE917|nr:alpha/beta hydrolase [Marinobacter sp.]MDX1634322.1 alpha/beta hydrolase [Marinobacter sp.]